MQKTRKHVGRMPALAREITTLWLPVSEFRSCEGCSAVAERGGWKGTVGLGYQASGFQGIWARRLKGHLLSVWADDRIHEDLRCS